MTRALNELPIKGDATTNMPLSPLLCLSWDNLSSVIQVTRQASEWSNMMDEPSLSKSQLSPHVELLLESLFFGIAFFFLSDSQFCFSSSSI